MASSSPIHDDVMSVIGTHSVPPYPSTDACAQRQVESQFHASYHEWSHSESSATDDAKNATHRSLDRELTCPSSPRPSKPQTLSAPNQPEPNTHPDSAISAHINYTYNTTRQDVPPLVKPSASYHSQSSTGHRNVFPSVPFERSLSSFPSSQHHGPLNVNHTRPRTSNQVFPQLPDLAAHYGIPQLLPPPPRTTPRRTSESSSNHQPESFSPFAQVCSNYLTMLSQPPNDPMNDDRHVAVTPADIFPPVDGTAEALYEALSASPEFSPEFPIGDFLTSPWDDSPFDDVLNTPGLGSTDMDMLTTPLLDDSSGDSMAMLFADMPIYDEMVSAKDQHTPPLNTDGMYTMMPSPVSPSLDPSFLYPSPRLPTAMYEQTSAGRRKVLATGTRKNITPESLVPLDAPTQPRKYVTPSSTSRKELPAVFARKRARSQAFGEDDDELGEEPLPPNATEKEQIEWKRRQNTLAARKSRKRKLQYQMELENTVEQLTSERETWKARALMYQSMLKAQGLEVPDFS